MFRRFYTWKDFKNVHLAFLPVGSMEQHGLHLPLDTDGIIASALASELASRFEPSFLLPLLPFSSSFEHIGFPGSVSLKVTTIASVITDVVDSLVASGINKCVIITGHMGNHLLMNIVQELNQNSPRVLLAPSRKHLDSAYLQAGLSKNPSQDMHAGEGETSIMLSLLPDEVHKDKLIDVDCPKRSLLGAVGMKYYTDTGTLGFPSLASAEKGRALLTAIADEVSHTVKEFLKIGQI